MDMSNKTIQLAKAAMSLGFEVVETYESFVPPRGVRRVRLIGAGMEVSLTDGTLFPELSNEAWSELSKIANFKKKTEEMTTSNTAEKPTDTSNSENTVKVVSGFIRNDAHSQDTSDNKGSK